MKKSVLAAAVLLLSAQQVSAVNLRIVGGAQAELEQYPFIAALVPRGGSATDTFCGASLLSPRWIMTAAHCLEGEQASTIDVLTGADNLERADEGERLSVKRIINHPQYDSQNVVNDIALIELDEASSATLIQPATVNDKQLIATGQAVSVAGWGDRSDGQGDYPSQLHAVNLTISNFSQCNTAYGGLSSAHVCAGTAAGGKDSCSGDSGGPLIARTSSGPIQVGIVSFGDSCGSRTHPGVYTRVSEFSDFINQYVPVGDRADSVADNESGVLDADVSADGGSIDNGNGNSQSDSEPAETDQENNSPLAPTDSGNADTLPEIDIDSSALIEADEQQQGSADSDNQIADVEVGLSTEGIEVVTLDDVPFALNEDSVAYLLEVFNGSQSSWMISNIDVDAGIDVSIDDSECLSGELQPGDACFVELLWDPREGALKGDLTLELFNGAGMTSLGTSINAKPVQQAEFGDTLDYVDADYYVDNPGAWDVSHQDSVFGGTSLTSDLASGDTENLSMDFMAESDIFLEFQYQMQNANCTILVDDQEMYFLAASDEWNSAVVQVPAGASVRWSFEPLSNYRDQSRLERKVRLDGFKLASPESLNTASVISPVSDLPQAGANLSATDEISFQQSEGSIPRGGAGSFGVLGLLGILIAGFRLATFLRGGNSLFRGENA